MAWNCGCGYVFVLQFTTIWANGILQCCLALYRTGYWAECTGLVALAFNQMRYGTDTWANNPSHAFAAPMFHDDWPGTVTLS